MPRRVSRYGSLSRTVAAGWHARSRLSHPHAAPGSWPATRAAAKMRDGGPASGRGRGAAPLLRPRRPAGLRPAGPRATCAWEDHHLAGRHRALPPDRWDDLTVTAWSDRAAGGQAPLPGPSAGQRPPRAVLASRCWIFPGGWGYVLSWVSRDRLLPTAVPCPGSFTADGSGRRRTPLKSAESGRRRHTCSPGNTPILDACGQSYPGTGEVPLPPAKRTSRFLLPEGTG